jgi:hypothetical protein
LLIITIVLYDISRLRDVVQCPANGECPHYDATTMIRLFVGRATPSKVLRYGRHATFFIPQRFAVAYYSATASVSNKAHDDLFLPARRTVRPMLKAPKGRRSKGVIHAKEYVYKVADDDNYWEANSYYRRRKGERIGKLFSFLRFQCAKAMAGDWLPQQEAQACLLCGKYECT